MKNEMRFQTLIARDVPAELDRRILAAASKRAAELRFRHARRRWFWAGSATAAAAAILVIAGAVLLLPEIPVPRLRGPTCSRCRTGPVSNRKTITSASSFIRAARRFPNWRKQVR